MDNPRAYDCRGPFGSKHRPEPPGVATVEHALDTHVSDLEELWKRADIHKWGKGVVRKNPPPTCEPS